MRGIRRDTEVEILCSCKIRVFGNFGFLIAIIIIYDIVPIMDELLIRQRSAGGANDSNSKHIRSSLPPGAARIHFNRIGEVQC